MVAAVMAQGKRQGKSGSSSRRRSPETAPEPRAGDQPEVVDGELVDEDELEAGDDDVIDDEDEVAGVIDLEEEGDAAEPGDIDAELERLIAERDEKGQEKAAARVSLIKRDPLTAYVQETRRYPLLSREEEHELAVRLVEKGDVAAARKLIESNLRLVVKIAYEYRRAHRNLLDLVQEGNIGLMQAVKKYDPYRGVKLSSYAAWWIRAYILKFILNNWRLVKIGTTQAQRKLFFNLRKERDKLEQLGFTPDAKQLAERLDVSEKDVVEMEKRLAAPDASLDAPLGGEDEGRSRIDLVEATEAGRPDLRVEQSEFQTLLREKLEKFAEDLKDREETIFRERWLTDEPLTLQQIGDRYGVSRERARQIEKRLMNRLRDFLEAELGTAVDIDALARD
jgi:RNA polymerase sigma-32 factor